ncbi:MAG: CHASE domain-containing protein, partial [Rubrivivax sp.]
VLAQPEWRAALLLARDSGAVAITNRLWSAGAPGSERESSVLMFMPVYEAGLPVDSVPLRQARLRGWIVASFRIDDLMSSLYGEGLPGVDVLVYDGVRASDETRMYPAQALPETQPVALQAQEYIGFAGHSWTVQLKSRPAFAQSQTQDAAVVIAIAGSGFSLLLALLTWQLVTASERANAAARAMTRQLRDSAERYRRIVDTANEGIWTIDAQQRTSFANPKLQALLGWRADEMLGRPCSDFLDAAGCAAISAGKHQPCEAQLRRRDGAELWVQLATSAIVDDEGRPAGVLVMVTDISERRLAEQRRSTLEAQLQQSQKMEAIGTLAGGIAHDFNNILAATLGHVSLLQQELAGQPGIGERLLQVRQASERARSLVQQIVTFSRRQPQALVVQQVQPLVAETAALLRSTLPAQVALDLQVAAEPLHVGADATQFQQVLMNLCTNAWHALQGSTGRIELGL